MMLPDKVRDDDETVRPKEVIFKKVNIYYLPETIRKLIFYPQRAIFLLLQLACLSLFCQLPASGPASARQKASVMIGLLPSLRLCTLLMLILWRMTVSY